ncbi:MAG: hypothetical protein ACIWVG_05535, partial [Gloeotrichia echinulata HAB0833]
SNDNFIRAVPLRQFSLTELYCPISVVYLLCTTSVVGAQGFAPYKRGLFTGWSIYANELPG